MHFKSENDESRGAEILELRPEKQFAPLEKPRRDKVTEYLEGPVDTFITRNDRLNTHIFQILTNIKERGFQSEEGFHLIINQLSDIIDDYKNHLDRFLEALRNAPIDENE